MTSDDAYGRTRDQIREQAEQLGDDEPHERTEDMAADVLTRQAVRARAQQA